MPRCPSVQQQGPAADVQQQVSSRRCPAAGVQQQVSSRSRCPATMSSSRCPAGVATDFGQTEFGQTDFGQIWGILRGRFWPDRLKFDPRRSKQNILKQETQEKHRKKRRRKNTEKQTKRKEETPRNKTTGGGTNNLVRVFCENVASRRPATFSQKHGVCSV